MYLDTGDFMKSIDIISYLNFQVVGEQSQYVIICWNLCVTNQAILVKLTFPYMILKGYF